jgi:hypothetical protein
MPGFATKGAFFLNAGKVCSCKTQKLFKFIFGKELIIFLTFRKNEEEKWILNVFYCVCF